MKMNFLDITKQKFGMLTPIRRLTEEEKKEQNINVKDTYWLCKCDCGNETVVPLGKLKNGGKKSCGCLKTNKAQEIANSRIGEKFGKLTIKSWHFELKNSKRVKRKIVFDCVCECGGTISCEYHELTSGHTKSCGCLSKYYLEKQQKDKSPDLTGQVFGKLTVIKKTDKRDVTGSVVWKCKCECGTITEVSAHCLLKGLIQSCRCVNSRGEEKISRILSENSFVFEKQYKFQNLLGRKNQPYFFDFAVKDSNNNLQYLIEFDGIQHFSYKGEKGWATKEKMIDLQERDHKKNQYCFNHNIPLIRIPYSYYDSLALDDLKIETTNFLLTKEGEQEYVFKNTPEKYRKDLADYYKLQKNNSTD